jgi:hypothetical protein
MDQNQTADRLEAMRIRNAHTVELLRAACKEAGSMILWAKTHGITYSYVKRC